MGELEGGGVLVVDDEALVAMHIAMIVEDAGMQVCGVAGSGAQALAVAAEARPTAAVLDIRLGPGLDGIEVAGRLRSLCDCGIVFVSGSGERETVARALAVEGVRFMQKPVNPDTLVEALRAVTSSARTLRPSPDPDGE